jgi:5'-nucleotidase
VKGCSLRKALFLSNRLISVRLGRMEEPLILLTNDDGYNSPGLLAAANALLDLGELLIVAPQAQQSGMSRAWLPGSTGAIYLRQVEVSGGTLPAYAVDGSPSQAVAHALLRIAPRRPDLAVSGINYGQNVGTAVTSSGTVGAALEAAISGIPSLAVSLEMDKAYYHSHSDEIDFSVAAHFARLFASRLLALPLPADVDVLKVDIPCDATPETPWRITRQSRRRFFVALPPERAPLGEPVRVDYRLDPSTSEPGTDTHTLSVRRRVSVTPLSFDLTSRTDLDRLEHVLSDGFDPAST